MQNFADSKELAKAKDINNLFGQINTFKPSDKAEAGSAEVQPGSNSLSGGNIKRLRLNQPLLIKNHFYRTCLKKPNLSDKVLTITSKIKNM